MTSEEYEDILFDHRILRWSARIMGTLEVLFLLSLAYDQLIKGLINQGLSAFIPLVNGQYFLLISLTIHFIGLIIAYWKEGLGGGISLACLIVMFIRAADFHVSTILYASVVFLPSVLYVAYWLSVHLAVKKAGKDQKTGL
jgi:hypothetical protein